MFCKSTTRRIRGRSRIIVETLLATPLPAVLLQLLPHADDARSQLGSELLISLLRSCRFRRRKEGVPNRNLEWSKALKRFLARPGIVEAFNGHRHNRHLQMNGENGSAFLEHLGRAVNRALALRVQNQHQPVPEPESAGAHGRNKV